MRICFSTLACPTWTLSQVIEIAASSGYQGIELRFLEIAGFSGPGVGNGEANDR